MRAGRLRRSPRPHVRVASASLILAQCRPSTVPGVALSDVLKGALINAPVRVRRAASGRVKRAARREETVNFDLMDRRYSHLDSPLLEPHDAPVSAQMYVQGRLTRVTTAFSSPSTFGRAIFSAISAQRSIPTLPALPRRNVTSMTTARCPAPTQGTKNAFDRSAAVALHLNSRFAPAPP
jgi:hypothetical protein